MIRIRLVPVVAAAIALIAAGSAPVSGESVVAISPGTSSAPDVTAAKCPTFSWAAAGAPESVELVLYGVDR